MFDRHPAPPSRTEEVVMGVAVFGPAAAVMLGAAAKGVDWWLVPWVVVVLGLPLAFATGALTAMVLAVLRLLAPRRR